MKLEKIVNTDEVLLSIARNEGFAKAVEMASVMETLSPEEDSGRKWEARLIAQDLLAGKHDDKQLSEVRELYDRAVQGLEHEYSSGCLLCRVRCWASMHI